MGEFTRNLAVYEIRSFAQQTPVHNRSSLKLPVDGRPGLGDGSRSSDRTNSCLQPP